MTDIWFASYLALWALVLVEGALIFVLMRELGVRLLKSSAEVISRDGLAVGTELPRVEAVTVEDRQTLIAPAPGRQLLLVFGSRRCQPCRTLAPDLNRFAHLHSPRLDALFVVDDNASGAGDTARDLGLRVPVVASRSAMDAYGVRVTPFAFILGEDSRVRAKGLASGEAGLRTLLSQADARAREDKNDAGTTHTSGEIDGSHAKEGIESWAR